jgi:hypothetical protein
MEEGELNQLQLGMIYKKSQSNYDFQKIQAPLNGERRREKNSIERIKELK